MTEDEQRWENKNHMYFNQRGGVGGGSLNKEGVWGGIIEQRGGVGGGGIIEQD